MYLYERDTDEFHWNADQAEHYKNSKMSDCTWPYVLNSALKEAHCESRKISNHEVGRVWQAHLCKAAVARQDYPMAQPTLEVIA